MKGFQERELDLKKSITILAVGLIAMSVLFFIQAGRGIMVEKQLSELKEENLELVLSRDEARLALTNMAAACGNTKGK